MDEGTDGDLRESTPGRKAAPLSFAPHESPQRKMMAFAAGREFVSYTALEAAKADPLGTVILEARSAEQLYVVCRAALVECTVQALQQLLLDLDAIAWSGQDPEGAHIFYERHPDGTVLAGGTGGGRVTNGLWIHPQFIRFELSDRIAAVIQGHSASLDA